MSTESETLSLPAVTVVTALKKVSIHGFSNIVTVCCYTCYCIKDYQYVRFPQNILTVCFYSCYCTKAGCTYGISNTTTLCCYSCYCTKGSQYLRYQQHCHFLLLQLVLYYRQSISTVSATLSLSAVTAVTVLKAVSTYGISNNVTVCCYSCYCAKSSQYLRYQQHCHCLLLQLLLC